GLSNIVAIIAGGYHSLALDSDGNVWAWGSGSDGEMGDGTTDSKHTPAQVPGVDSITAIAATEMSCYALRSNGTVYGWGSGGWGELAQGGDDWTDKLSPVVVVPDGVKAIAAGGTHALFIKTDGTLEACGSNWSGQLGDGTTETKNYLVSVVGLTDVVAAATGMTRSLALTGNGTLWEWGGANTIPVPVVLPGANTPPVIELESVDITVPENTSVTIDLSGSQTDAEDGPAGLIWLIWGVDESLFTASINPATDELTITPVTGATGSDVVTLTLTDSGGLTAVQDVTITITAAINNPPVILSVIPDITTSENIPAVFDLTAYESDTEDGPAADDNNLIWSISDVDETLFTASIDSGTDVLTITPVLDASGTNVVTLTLTDSGGATDSQDIIIGIIGNVGVSLMAGGNSHSYVVYEGVVWGWGWNGNGQVGDGTENNTRWSPVSTSFSGVESLASGGWAHSLSLKPDGTVWGWGDNHFCQLGIGVETVFELIPVQALVLEDIKTIEAGHNHSLALKSDDGTVWAWGYNGYGQIGIGSDIPSEQPIPVQVPGLAGIIDIAGGGSHNLAVKSDGTVWAWGRNWEDQLA
ncbi:MAG: hypothetical protein KAQ99_06005, partial [Candidatus Aureabacteria bacterium]|nr:hypothetical protein [Candidatus Auribacterota bacterium]